MHRLLTYDGDQCFPHLLLHQALLVWLIRIHGHMRLHQCKHLSEVLLRLMITHVQSKHSMRRRWVRASWAYRGFSVDYELFTMVGKSLLRLILVESCLTLAK